MTGDGNDIESAHCSPVYQLHSRGRRDALGGKWVCAMASPLSEADFERACASTAEARTAVPRPGESRTDGRGEWREEGMDQEKREEEKGRGYHVFLILNTATNHRHTHQHKQAGKQSAYDNTCT
jgi:hypothetical protein